MTAEAAPLPREAARLGERLRALDALAERADGRLPVELVGRANATLHHAGTRLGHGSAHTVVAIAGATGSGKSSLFNALVGAPVAEVDVRRPTTSTTQAAIFGGGADSLLDWLDVPRRHVTEGGALDGLVLLDLPDHDSVVTAHRDEVERLVRVVDAFLWVVDPQKYADAALHRQYLSRFAARGVVSVVVLNHIDTVPDERDRREMLDHLARLLRDDGIDAVRTIAVSARTGEGVDQLRRELAARVSERRALVARLDADLDWLVDDLRVAVGDVTPQPIARDDRRRLEDAFAYAAGIDAVADAVGAAHRHRSSQRAGWPPVRWVGRLRPDPLRRLGLDRLRVGASRSPGDAIPRSSRPRADVVADAAVDEALRGLAKQAAAGLPEHWGDRVHDVAFARRDDVADELDVAVTSASFPTTPPRWWAVASIAQWTFTVALVTGLLWLLLIGVVAWFRLPDLPTPDIGPFPAPTLLALGGAAGGILVAALTRWAAAAGGRRRSARTRRTLTSRVSDVAQALVIDPVDAELAHLAELQTLVRRLER